MRVLTGEIISRNNSDDKVRVEKQQNYEEFRKKQENMGKEIAIVRKQSNGEKLTTIIQYQK